MSTSENLEPVLDDDGRIIGQRSDQPTPAGGAYSIMYYRNDGGVCEREQATEAEIHEFDVHGKLIMTTHGYLDGGR